MRRIPCATIWGGIQEESIDVCSRSVEASLYSSAAEGGKGGDIYFLSVCGQDALTRVALADVAGHGKSVSDVSQWLFDCLESSMESVEGNRVLEDGSGMILAGMPRIAAGEETLLFLSAEGATGVRMPVGLSQGKFRVIQTEDGGRWIAICRMASINRLIAKPETTMKFARRRPQISDTTSVSRKVRG